MSEKQGVRETDTQAWVYRVGLRDYLLQSLAVEPLVPVFEGAQYAGAQEADNGFWVLLGDEELPVPFSEFPWFRTATVVQVATLERPTVNHLYWPLLDMDLAVDSLRDPKAFPLVSKARC